MYYSFKIRFRLYFKTNVTRWESPVKSIKPIRFQLFQVHDALVEVGKLTKDPK